MNKKVYAEEGPTQTYYSTKYATTKGILEFQGYVKDDYVYETPRRWNGLSGKLGREIHETLEEAQADTLKRWQQKARALENQLKKAQAMAAKSATDFTPTLERPTLNG